MLKDHNAVTPVRLESGILILEVRQNVRELILILEVRELNVGEIRF